MRHEKALLPLLLVAGLVLLTCAVTAARGGAAPAAGTEPNPTTTPSVEPTATPAPASSQTVRHALQHRARAQRSLRGYKRAAAAFLRHPQVRLWQRPDRGACDSIWLRAGQRWAQQRERFDRQASRLVDRARHPGGSSNGVRWLPLARLVGWPEYALRSLAALVMNESSGIERNVSPTDDHGLVQFNRPSWQRTWARVMGSPFFPGGQAAARKHRRGVYDPELNLRFAWHVFHVVQHNSFLPAWRGDPAATF